MPTVPRERPHDQTRKEIARRRTPVLREVGALIAKGKPDTVEDGIMSRGDSIAECGATQHDVGRRFGRRPTRTSAVLFPTPFDKFGHGGELPCNEADAGLDGTWR